MTVLDETDAPTAAAREYARSAMRRLLYGVEAERNAG